MTTYILVRTEGILNASKLTACEEGCDSLCTHKAPYTQKAYHKGENKGNRMFVLGYPKD